MIASKRKIVNECENWSDGDGSTPKDYRTWQVSLFR